MTRASQVHPTLGVVVCLLAAAGPAAAASSSPAVHRADLPAVLRHLRGNLNEDLARGAVTLGILLDQGSTFRAQAQGEALAAAWEEAFGAADPLSGSLTVLVAACGISEPAILGEPARHDSPRVGELLQLATEEYSDIPNVMGNIRGLARALSRAPGSRHLVAFVLDWVDAEQDVESTRETLQAAGCALHIIGRGGYQSDSYWILRPPTTSASVRKQKMDMHGADAAYREVPVGWLFDRNSVYEETPAGFGPYGLSRLAAATGGSYYVYYPTTPSSSFCQSVGCPLCGGQHTSCDPWFNESVLNLLAPDYGPRSEARKRLTAGPLAQAVLSAWERVEDAECLQTQPPINSSSGAARRDLPSPRFRSSLLKATTCKSRVRWVDRTTAKLERALAVLEQALAQSRENAPRRVVANAELLQAQILALLFNIDQFRRFNLAIEAEFSGKDPVDSPETPMVPADAKSCCTRRYLERNLYFCHGTAPIREVEFLDGEGGDARLQRLLAVVDRNLDRYRNTPWEIGTRRIALALFSLPPPST